MTERSRDDERTDDSFEALLRQGAAPLHTTGRHVLERGTQLAGGRFEIGARLGEGGMGVVYEAFDSERLSKVALKTLYLLESAGIDRLKSEFRALADVSHPHVVRLHELFADDGLWFFTMDLVDGLPFDAWVRPGRALDERRLRAALPQLLDGVLAIHQAGKLHRDLKPSNVLVTTGGSVVILDFGLAADLAAPGVEPTLLEDRYDGTPAYMAPEQAAGEAASAASDFYALGVMLFKALAGELPFRGRSFEILKMKQARAAPAVTEENPHAPEDLVAVCAALLNTKPYERPSSDTLSSLFGRATKPGSASMRDWNAPRGLVGRESDLLALRAAYTASCDGDKPVVVLLSGESGIGKSALIESFLPELRETSSCSVLSGRCYERENVPFKAFDPVIDELSRYLGMLSPAERAAVMPPRGMDALRRLFPVLGRSEAVAEAQGSSLPDAFELRRQGFSELGEVFGRLRARQPLVIAIDDLQWGDQDSTTLLLHLLRQPDAARMLVIVSHRSEGMADNPVLAMLYEAALGDPRFDARQLALAPLATEAAALLVGRELGDAASVLLREAGGNPFLLQELARAWSVSNHTSLGEMLRARVSALPEGERALLEVLSVAARPLSLQLAAAAAHAVLPARAAFDALRSAHLARSGVHPGSIECYHDRVRESVAAGLTAETRRKHHSALAQQLVQSPDADPEHLAEHFEHAGEPLRAAEYAVSAANHAADGFAFAQAARLYDKALSLGSFSGAETQRLRVALADALSHGGGGRLAAEAYLRAAQGTCGLDALELESSAAAHYVGSGAIARGRELTLDILSSLGLHAPGSPVSAIATLVVERARMRLRGSRDFARHVRRVDPEQERHLEALQRAVTGLAQVDLLSHSALNLQLLHRARAAGNARAVVRGLRLDILCRSFGLGSADRVPELLQETESLIERLADPTLAAWQFFCRAVYEMFGRSDGADELTIACFDRFLAYAKAEPGLILAHERTLAESLRISALVLVGRFSQAAGELPALIDEAWQRGDLFRVPSYCGPLPTFARLVVGASAEAQRDHPRAARAWAALGNTYTYQDVSLHQGRAAQLVFQGDLRAAWAACVSHDAPFRNSFTSKTASFACGNQQTRGCIAAALAAETSDAASRSAFLREAEWIPPVLRMQSKWRRSLLIPQAAAACARRDRDTAVRLLREYDQRPPPSAPPGPLRVQANRRRLGILLGGDEGRAMVATADAFLCAGGAIDPERAVSIAMPGCEIR